MFVVEYTSAKSLIVDTGTLSVSFVKVNTVESRSAELIRIGRFSDNRKTRIIWKSHNRIIKS